MRLHDTHDMKSLVRPDRSVDNFINDQNCHKVNEKIINRFRRNQWQGINLSL